MNNQLSFIPLGGIGDVTKNMYLYEYGDQILIVDCGLGFADETMLGVDLLLPDISYLLKTKKKIVGMLLTHGHEDHIGALPFLLPQLPEFPIFGTPLTAAFANEKLKDFNARMKVQPVKFSEGEKSIGNFKFSFIPVTHSVSDTSHIFIKTPAGNFYHGSDFKFDDTPYDGKKSDYSKISQLSSQGVMCLLSDCLGAERAGRTPSDIGLTGHFDREMKACRGKFIVTTYSSNIARLNQVIEASLKNGRRICFVGRSLIKNKEVSRGLGYLNLKKDIEVEIDALKNYEDNKLTLVVAGSQGQENSALTRIANGEHRDVKLSEDDVIVFSSDPIPGNETSVYELIDTLTRRGVRVVYSPISRDFHVSGHASVDELEQLIKLVKPKNMIPIGGQFRHMFAYKKIAERLGYKKNDVFLMEDGQELLFSNGQVRYGRTIPIKNVYVDELSGEELESFVLRDRQKLSEAGIIIILAEVDRGNGQLVGNPDIIVRGLSAAAYDSKRLNSRLMQDFHKALSPRKTRVTNWIYIRKLIGETAERRIYKDLRRRPLVLPVVIEV
ncbi:MAG: ribonuclease J [Candidatus Levybacteria bacterium]|nr:ribonuclease J [Candidatus Levybacteria bacterium]